MTWWTIAIICLGINGYMSFKKSVKDLEEKEAIPKTLPVIYSGPSAIEIEREILRANRLDNLNYSSREFKPTIFSDYEKKYMPKS